IHSNPPGIYTDYPAAILKDVGKGHILWLAAPIENARPYMSRLVVGRMIKSLCHTLQFTSTAPTFVEIVAWEKDGKNYVAAINQQETAPIVPMFNIEITLPYLIKEAHLVESEQEILLTVNENSSTLKLPELAIFALIEITKSI
ncbi:MAG: hypothetical protein RSF70_00215, partial [Ruthenibacterium sp.]